MGRPGGFIVENAGMWYVVAFVDGLWDYRGRAFDQHTAERLLAARVDFIRREPLLALRTRNSEIPDEVMAVV